MADYNAEEAPDVTPKEFEKMDKKATTAAKKPAAHKKAAPQSAPAESKALPKRAPAKRAPAVAKTTLPRDFPEQVFALYGWSPRITIYVFGNEDVRKYKRDTEGFIAHSVSVGARPVGAFTVTEIGSLPKGETLMRVAEVKVR
jgi:hypothetical protein